MQIGPVLARLLCRPLLLLPLFFPSIRVFSNEITEDVMVGRHHRLDG